MAHFWADQADRLAEGDGNSLYPRIDIAPPPLPSNGYYTPRTIVAAVVAITDPREQDDITDPALGTGRLLSWAFDHAKIADAVQRLESHTDEDYGPVPQPDPALAAELEEHMEHSH